MGDFFHGWRRKIGMLTLVMACVLAGGWIRSFQPDNGFVLFGEYVESSHPGIIESVFIKRSEQNGMTVATRCVRWSIAYWSIVIPLTLLSAYLLFNKPRLPIKPSASRQLDQT